MEEPIATPAARPPRPTSRSRSLASARTARATAAAAGAHVVDRALAVHALLAAGRTPAEVQRRLGKSKGYVSVLGYLGRALAGLEPDDLARLRCPALTPRAVWSLVTRARSEERAALKQASDAVATDAAREEVRRRTRDRAIVQLRSALRAHAQAAAAGLAAAPKPRGGRRPRAQATALGMLAFDPAAWAADPVAYARAHLAALAAAHAHVAERATRAVGLAGVEQAIAGWVATAGEGSLHSLSGTRWRALADTLRAARSPIETRALAALAVVSRKLREAQNELAHLTSTGTRAPIDLDRNGLQREGVALISWADVEADLGD